MCRSEQKLRDQDLGQVIQDLSEISFRKNVAIDIDLDATLAKLEPRSAMMLRLASDSGSRVKSRIKFTGAWPEKIMKEKSSKLQAASLTASPRDDRIQSELV